MKLHIQLQAEGANAPAQQFEIPFAGDAVVIGRGPESPLPLEGTKLSRNHAVFGIHDGRLTLTDLSSNGVWVDAQPIPKKSAVALNGTEEITIPGYRLRVRLLVPPPEPPPPAAIPAPAPAAVAKASAAAPPSAATSTEIQLRSVDIPQRSAEMAQRATGELSADAVARLSESPQDTGPRWWHLSTAERMVLFLVSLSIGLLAYYYSLQ